LFGVVKKKESDRSEGQAEYLKGHDKEFEFLSAKFWPSASWEHLHLPTLVGCPGSLLAWDELTNTELSVDFEGWGRSNLQLPFPP
jgi:hypothetical protein